MIMLPSAQLLCVLSLVVGCFRIRLFISRILSVHQFCISSRKVFSATKHVHHISYYWVLCCDESNEALLFRQFLFCFSLIFISRCCCMCSLCLLAYIFFFCIQYSFCDALLCCFHFIILIWADSILFLVASIFWCSIMMESGTRICVCVWMNKKSLIHSIFF